MDSKGAEEARNRLPELLDAAEKGETTIITRRDRRVAALVLVDSKVSIARQPSLLQLEGSGKGMWGKDSTLTIRKLRDEWERRCRLRLVSPAGVEPTTY